jgi:hypothetical protein
VEKRSTLSMDPWRENGCEVHLGNPQQSTRFRRVRAPCLSAFEELDAAASLLQTMPHVGVSLQVSLPGKA